MKNDHLTIHALNMNKNCFFQRQAKQSLIMAHTKSDSIYS